MVSTKWKPKQKAQETNEKWKIKDFLNDKNEEKTIRNGANAIENNDECCFFSLPFANRTFVYGIGTQNVPSVLLLVAHFHRSFLQIAWNITNKFFSVFLLVACACDACFHSTHIIWIAKSTFPLMILFVLGRNKNWRKNN